MHTRRSCQGFTDSEMTYFSIPRGSVRIDIVFAGEPPPEPLARCIKRRFDLVSVELSVRVELRSQLLRDVRLGITKRTRLASIDGLLTLRRPFVVNSPAQRTAKSMIGDRRRVSWRGCSRPICNAHQSHHSIPCSIHHSFVLSDCCQLRARHHA